MIAVNKKNTVVAYVDDIHNQDCGYTSFELATTAISTIFKELQLSPSAMLFR